MFSLLFIYSHTFVIFRHLPMITAFGQWMSPMRSLQVRRCNSVVFVVFVYRLFVSLSIWIIVHSICKWIE